jgi:hypothetical protein
MVSDPMGDDADSDTSGCSSSSEDMIVLASAVAAAFVFMSILHICANTGSHSNVIAERAVGRRLVELGTGSDAG